MMIRILATTTEELREAVSRCRKGDTIFALPGAASDGVVIPEGVSLVTTADAVDHSWRAIQWAVTLYRSL
jgi:hypothetical protein